MKQIPMKLSDLLPKTHVAHGDTAPVHIAQWSKTSVRGGENHYETPHHPTYMEYESFSFAIQIQRYSKKLSCGIIKLLRKINFIFSEPLI